MSENNRIYFERRAQEEQEQALHAVDVGSASIHRRLQRAYLEKALVGDRSGEVPTETVG